MSVPSHEPTRPRDSTFTAAFSLIAACTACAVVLVTMPRAVEPAQLPPLVLDSSAARAALEYDAHAASRAPHSAELDELYNLYLEEGRAERDGVSALGGTASRRRRIATLTRRLFATLGKDKVVSLRARATERFFVALAGKLEVQAEADGLVGTFPDVLRKRGLLDLEGHVRAPELCVRALYKARWNMIHERPLLEHFEPIELLAYHGWVALHAQGVPLPQRAESARLFHQLKGHRGAEAHATFLYLAKARPEAASLFEQGFERTRALRMRNMLLAARAEPTP